MLTDQEKIRLNELRAKKKLAKDGKGLSADEFKEYQDLGKRAHEGGGNPISSYMQYPELFRDSANLAMNFIPGTVFDPENDIDITGAAKVVVFPMMGKEAKAVEGFNLAVRDLWLLIHRKYRGLNAYEASDVGIVLLATKDVFNCAAELEKVYGVINRYDVMNRNLPRVLLEALGVNETLADDIRKNLADFRYKFNQLMHKAQQMFMPNDYPIIQEQVNLFGFIYADSDSKYAQLINFTAACYGKYEATLFPTGSSVSYHHTDTESDPELHGRSGWMSGMYNYSDPLNYLEERIDALVGDSDVQKIYSDMAANLGVEHLTQLRVLDENWQLKPVYDKSILHKFHNLTQVYGLVPTTILDTSGHPEMREVAFASQILSKDAYYFYQSDNVIHTACGLVPNDTNGRYVFKQGNRYQLAAGAEEGISIDGKIFKGGFESILDVQADEATVQDIFEGCLWKVAAQYEAAQGVDLADLTTAKAVVETTITSVATELIGDITLYSSTRASSRDVQTAVVRLNNTAQYATLATLHICQYDWSPIVYRYSDAGKVVDFVGDVQCCRMVRMKDFYRMHECAVMSVWKTNIQVKG